MKKLKNMDAQNLITKLVTIVSSFIIGFTVCAIISIDLRENVTITEEPDDCIIVEEVNQELSEWEIMKMALIEVESEFQPYAISEKGAVGIYQITPTYVREVNRITGTNFNHIDAKNDSHANYMFEAIQSKYNESKDIVKAIKLHNPNAGDWYVNRVMYKMELVKRREQVRKIVHEYAN